MQVYLCLDICAFPAHKKTFVNSGMLITISFFPGEIPGLELVTQPYFTSECTIIMTKTSSAAMYFFLHLSLPCAILTNGTQEANQCPTVKEDTVCSLCLINISEAAEGIVLSSGRWMLGW